MTIFRKALSRRRLLKGIGTSLALPFLDSMLPALGTVAKAAGKTPLRFGAYYVPMGIMMENWTPKTYGKGFEFAPIMQPVSAFRDSLTVVSGLDSVGSGHPNATVAFLTDVRSAPGADIHAGVSMDQLIAAEIGQDNKLPSLELGIETMAIVGDCENRSCTYYQTLSYRTPTTPLPVECDPRVVFERLFGDPESTTPAARLERIKEQRSVLDSVTEDVADLNRRIGRGDRTKVGEYLDAVREVERRIQKAEAASAASPTVEAPPGIPPAYADHVKLMFDLQVLAFQSDLTRVSTLLLARESSNHRYSEAGVSEPHHSMTHHPDPAGRFENVTKINAYHVSLFAHMLEKMAATPDGDGSLLDHTILLYGSGLSDGNLHLGSNVPIVLAGHGNGSLKGGRHVRYDGQPLANLHMALMDKYGVKTDKLGNSSGKVEGLSI